MRQFRACVLLGVLFVLLGSGGCTTLGYYGQAAAGQTKLLLARRSTDGLLASERTPDALKGRLQKVREILRFAEVEIGLPVAGRYDRYVALNRDYVVWNVVAAPELSLEPVQSCFPIAGCVPYRGFFSERAARKHAARLERRGYETAVRGVAAYSTLGWFDDPLLSSFINWPDGYLASLLFHELAHGVIWVKGDAAFNEAFASFVGERAAREWLAARPMELTRFDDQLASSEAFRAKLNQLRQRLAALYRTRVATEEMRRRKANYLAAFSACLDKDVQATESQRRIARERINNAYLAAGATYRRWLPAFGSLFKESNGNWSVFFDAVGALAAMPPAQRRDVLRQKQVATQRDGQRTEQVQCKTLARHAINGEPAG